MNGDQERTPIDTAIPRNKFREKPTVGYLQTQRCQKRQTREEKRRNEKKAGGQECKYNTNWQAEDQASACQWLVFAIST
jgi:hypothetical protein